MADPRNTTTLSRRALMSVSVGLVTANVAAAAIAVRAAQARAPAAPVDAAADAELVELCRRWCRLDRVHLHTDEKAAAADGIDEEAYDLFNEVAGNIWDKMATLAQEIAERPAHSWHRIAAKAACVKRAVNQVAEALEDGHCILVIVPGMVDDIAMARCNGDEAVNPTPIVLELMERSVAPRPGAIFFRPVAMLGHRRLTRPPVVPSPESRSSPARGVRS